MKIVFLSLFTTTFTFSTVFAQDSAVGYVESKTGVSGNDFWVMRDKKKIEPRAGTPIYIDDLVSVATKSSSITMRLEGYKSAIVLQEGESLLIKRPEKRSIGATASNFIKSVNWAFKTTDRKKVKNTAARSGGQQDGASTYLKLAKLPMLNSPELFATHDLPDLTVRWCGDSSNIEAWLNDNVPLSVMVKSFTYGTGTFQDLKDESEFEGVIGPKEIAVLPVSSKDKVLKFKIKWTNLEDVPRPTSLKGVKKLSLDQQFFWAKWLLTENSDDAYNLIGLNLLTNIRDEYWPAGLLLENLTHCEGKLKGPVL